MKTFMDTQKNALLRKFHALLRTAGITPDEKMAMLASYGVESSRDLSVYELTELCHKLDLRKNPTANEANRWRRRVLAVVCQYLELMHQPSNLNMAKAVACRAAGTDSFNSIPIDRLRSIYNAFRHRVADIHYADRSICQLLIDTGLRQNNELKN